MVESSDARAAALERLVAAVLAGEPVERHEGQLLDCKEDPSRPDKHGAALSGEERSEALAKTAADAVACFANADGGVVVVGVDDKRIGKAAFVGTSCDTAWLQNRVRQLVAVEVQARAVDVSGARIVAITVEPSPVPVSDTSRSYRRRQGRDCQTMSGAELGTFSVHRSGTDWSSALSASGVTDTDPAALAQVRLWLRQSGETSRLELADSDDRTLLRQLGLGDADGRLNRAGELLCVRLPGRGPLMDLTCRPAPGADTELRIDPTETPLALVLAEMEAAISVRNPQYNLPGGLAVGQVRALPDLALREALVNAAAHRDWAASGPIRIQLEGTQLTVMSPGGFLPGVTAATVITAPPRTRNPRLARALRGLRLAEAEGIGVDRMFRETVRQGLPTPSIEELPDGTGVRCVLIGGPPDPAIVGVVRSLPGPASQDIDVLLILHTLESRASVNATQLAPVIQKTRAEASAALSRAQNAGLAVPASREGHFRLADGPREQLKARLPYLRRTEADYARVITDLLHDHGEVRARDLIDACGIGQVQASRALAQAAQRGQVERHGATGAGVFYTSPDN